MMLSRTPRLRTLLCLCFYLSLAIAARFAPVKRDDAPSTTQLPVGTPSPGPTSIPTGSIAGESNSTALSAGSSTSSVNSTSTTGMVSSITPMPTAINSTSGQLNTTLFNSTVAAGELPLTPRITPTYAVAGVILIGTGTGYALVGIKTKWVHSFMASAYLASLGTALLILYVMVPPITDAVQGAYLVAIVCTGVILGAAAVVFKDITECLGCLLGGFCFSMWLLTLGEGGLVQQTGLKVVFITLFTLAAFATYFTRWTRHYGLITCISFSGATAAVLGIDCFSRAGLKEFWAYIWDLNEHLFPLGAETYPLTKGIRVELAATVLIFLAGMISQLKLWKVIQQKRARREAQREEGRRALEHEDANVGQQVEMATHRERRQWERVYGDGANLGFADSGVGDMGSEMKARNSGTVVTTSRVVSPGLYEDQSQMVEIPLEDEAPQQRRTVLFRDTRAGRVTANVAPDDAQVEHGSGSDDGPANEKKVWVVGSDGEARLQRATSKTSRAISQPPQLVPLPFQVPTAEEDAYQDNRSSVAAYVDDEGEVRSLADSRRNSLARRLSVGSGKLLRSLSQRSKANTVASLEAGGESRERLAVSRQSRRYDDDDSLAANLDDLSSEEACDVSDGEDSRDAFDMGQALSKLSREEKRKSEERSTQAWLSPARSKFTDIGLPRAETPSSPPPNPVNAGDPDKAGDPNGRTAEAKEDGRGKDSVADCSDSPKDSVETSPEDKSVRSAESGRAALKPEHLPRPLSRVALSYRTNEWAKHLSHAETPEPENLILNPYFGDVPETVPEEPAPVDVEELQKTAETASRPAAAPRSGSAMSNYSAVPQQISRANSRVSLLPAEGKTVSPTGQSFPPQVHKNPKRRSSNRPISAQPLAQPIAEEGADNTADSRSPTIPEEINTPTTTPSPLPPDPASTSSLNLLISRPPVPGVVSYSSPQTLIGRREMLLRNKSQASFYAAPIPEPGTMPTIYSLASSEAGSTYGLPATAGLGIGGPSSRDSLGNDASLDDLPLSQRRHILRQSSLDLSTQQLPYLATASTTDFDSHQPLRHSSSHLPTEAARQAQLASFRSSVQADLRHGAPPFAGSPYGGSGNGAWNASATRVYGGRDADVRRSVEQQRSFLLSQKEAEARRREAERVDRERSNAEFEERMRRGELLDAHREAMRRLQGGVKDV